MTKITITPELVKKAKSVIECGLSNGLGVQEPGKMCIEAAICYTLGLPHSDDPKCVGSAVRSYKIRLNDARWSSNDARAKGLIKLGIAQLNSIELDQKEFAKRVTFKNINTIIADLAKKYLPEIEQELREVKEEQKAVELCNQLKSSCRSAAAAYYAAADAAYYAANAAAYAAADDADAANAAAAAYAADAADAAAAADAYYAAADDKVLNQAAQNGLEVLQEMGSEGCKFLYLLEE